MSESSLFSNEINMLNALGCPCFLLRKRELCALLPVYYDCHVLCHFLIVPLVGLQAMIVAVQVIQTF